MRQVDFDFFEQRVVDNEFRQLQCSELYGTGAEFFALLLADYDVVAAEYEDNAHVRTLFTPAGSRPEYFPRSVGENQRLVAA